MLAIPTEILASTCPGTSPGGKLRLSESQAKAALAWPQPLNSRPQFSHPATPSNRLFQECVLSWPGWQQSALPPFSVPLGCHGSILRPK